MTDGKLFLGRQPILDSNQNLIAYELLFRSADSLHANVTNERQASAHVIVHALSDFGIEGTLGIYKGFMNVSHDILMSDALELLPKEQVVIELLETIKPTSEVINRCRDLKRNGFTIALDDHDYDPSFASLYELVDIIKIDLLAESSIPIEQSVKCLRKWPITLLAEKVETVEQFHQCLEFGFQMFQGFYFAKPTVIQQANVNITTMTLMRLMDQVINDVDIKEIEETFKQNPELIYNILRLVNSVYIGVREKIKALRHALCLLGREHLKRWVMLSLFATSSGNIKNSPLLELAAVRGKFMELMMKGHPANKKDPDYSDRAFMTGVLSLVDTLFNVSMENIVKQCNLSDDMQSALLYREGLMGCFLQAAEHAEQARFDKLSLLLQQICISAADFSAAYLEAVKWTNTFVSAI